ncbi:MAG: TFIIH complex subunit tfb5 [Candelina mexicana]|nr:MAG: TFIIH complex subunit tfb5 [Candelina mexicana]
MPKATKGVLVECDPAIKAIIMKIDSVNNDFVTEDLDDQTLLVKESKLPELKQRLEEELANTQQMPDESGSE